MKLTRSFFPIFHFHKKFPQGAFSALQNVRKNLPCCVGVEKGKYQNMYILFRQSKSKALLVIDRLLY